MSSGAGATETETETETVLPAPRSAILFLGVLAGVQAADPTIASTALVDASRGLQMSSGTTTLAASISTLVLAATAISAGLLGSRHGWRRLLLGGLLLSIAGDLTAAVAPSPAVYLGGRALAGAGLAAVYSAAFGFIRVITPKDRMANALGLFTASASAVLLVVSVTGGVLASASWRLAFLLVPAACALSLLGARALLPETEPDHDRPADVGGQVLLGAGVLTTLVGLSHLSKGPGAPLFWVPVLAGMALFVGFAWHESRSPTPFFPLDVLRRPLFLAAICAGFVYNFAQSATILQFSNLWQYVDGLTPSAVSFGLLPFMIIGIAAALLTGRSMARGTTDGRVMFTGGSLVALGGLATLLHTAPGRYWMLLPSLLLIGFGATMASIPYGALVVRAASAQARSFYGPITSSRTTFGQIAYSLGLSLSMVMVDRLTTSGVVQRLEAAGVPPSRTGSGLDAVTQFADTGTRPSTELGRQALSVAKESYATSFKLTMIAVGLVALLAGVAGAALLRRCEPAPEPGRPSGAQQGRAATSVE